VRLPLCLQTSKSAEEQHKRKEKPSRDHVTIWFRFIGCDGKLIEYGRSTEKVEIDVVSYRVPKRSCEMPGCNTGHNFGHNWPIRAICLFHKSFRINYAPVAQHG